MTFPQLRVHSQYAPLAGMIPIKTIATGQPACIADPNLWAQVKLAKAANNKHLPAMEIDGAVIFARGKSGWAELRVFASKIGEKADLTGLRFDNLVLLGLPGTLSGIEFGARWAEISPTMGAAQALTVWNQASDLGIRIAVTSSASYATRGDAASYAVLRAIATKRQVNRELLTRLDAEVRADPLTASWGHLAERDELLQWLTAVLGKDRAERALSGTDELAADLGTTSLGFGSPCMPDLLGSDGLPLTVEQQTAALVQRSRAGVIARGGGEEHIRRLEEELEVINSLGYAGYFLTVADIVAWAKSQKIAVGPGRGSAPGSVCVWALGITLLDPVVHGMLFERFMNRERVSYPDIDLDFDKRRREEIVNYLRERYGKNSVGRILNLKPLTGKTALKDVGRAFGLSFGELNALTANLPNTVAGKPPNMAWLRENVPALREPKYAEIVRHASALEGCIRESSVHASGVVVSRGPLTDWAPTCLTSGRALCAQWGWEDVETAGLIKFDLLGLTTVTHLDIAERLVREKEVQLDQLEDRFTQKERSGGAHRDGSEGHSRITGCIPKGGSGRSRRGANCQRIEGDNYLDGQPNRDRFCLEDVPLDDAAAYALMAKGDTLGVFQLGKPGMRKMLTQLRPSAFEHLTAAVALWRPGPIQGGMVRDFIARRHGREPVKYLHPALEVTTGSTYGTLCYQEQIMATCRILAGYTLGSADLMRRAMHKKRPEEMAQHRAKFIDGCIASQSCDAVQAGKIFEFMSFFAGYGFNKSVDKDTIIRDALGNEKKITEFKPGDCVLCVDSAGVVRPTNVLGVHDHGEIDGYEVEFSDGSKIICSANHKFLTEFGQVSVQNIVQFGLEVFSANPMWAEPQDKHGCASPSCKLQNVPCHEKEARLWTQTTASQGKVRSHNYRIIKSDSAPRELCDVSGSKAEKHIRPNEEVECRQREDAGKTKANIRHSEKNVCATRHTSQSSGSAKALARCKSREIQEDNQFCCQKIWGEEPIRTGIEGDSRLALCTNTVWNGAKTSRFCVGKCMDRGRWILPLLRENWLVSRKESENEENPARRTKKRPDVECGSVGAWKYLLDQTGHVLFSQLDWEAEDCLGTVVAQHAKITDTRGLVRRRIIRASAVGKRRMYDLEVATDTHNYVLPSGIITSNSHSTVYALTAYWTAYLKVHYPIEFYAAWLSTLCDESDRFKKIPEAVYDLRERGLVILPPDVNASSRDFKPVMGEPIAQNEQIRPAANRGLTGLVALIAKRAQNARQSKNEDVPIDGSESVPNQSSRASQAQIRYGLGAIRGLGKRAIDEILASAPFCDMADLLRRVKLTRRDLEALIESGACDGVLAKSGHIRADAAASLDVLIKWISGERIAPDLNGFIFVFGSNLAGRHGAGAAKTAALKYGAIRGCGEGFQGRSYAIPTKDRNLNSLSLEEIAVGVSRFIQFAKSRPDLNFQITRIGCGLAGYQDVQIAPMFTGAPNNCYLPAEWH